MRGAAAQCKIGYEQNLSLVCSASWVSAPALLSLSYVARTIWVKVDPTGLPPGAHYAAVSGPLFPRGLCTHSEYRRLVYTLAYDQKTHWHHPGTTLGGIALGGFTLY